MAVNDAKLHYVGIIYAERQSPISFARALERQFSQPIREGSFVVTLAPKRVSVASGTGSTLAGVGSDALAIGAYVVAIATLLKEYPTALAILERWLGEIDCELALIFLASHLWLVERVKQICASSGLKSKNNALDELPECAKCPDTARSVEADKVHSQISDEMQRLLKDYAEAHASDDSAKARQLFDRMNELDEEGQRLAGATADTVAIVT